MLDILGGLAGCIITGILCIFVGPAIYIQSPGPIFFKQTRVGKNGKLFQMYKFRSMYMDAEERKAELMKENRVQDGMMFKLDLTRESSAVRSFRTAQSKRVSETSSVTGVWMNSRSFLMC